MKLPSLTGALVCALLATSTHAEEKKPNILIIWGDDVGMWNLSAYHRGMMGGSTPNIDRIADEGMIFKEFPPSHRSMSVQVGNVSSFINAQVPSRWRKAHHAEPNPPPRFDP